jgi:ABC-2 type transport system ATP-binding protein
MSVLQLRNIHKNFSGYKAVSGINLNIQEGSIFGLLGPNGAGKTTLLRIITGIFMADDGDIFFDGHSFDPVTDSAMIGYMPEERGLYKKMKVGEQALYLGQLKGLSYHEAAERVKYWFEKLGMNGWWNKKVEDLSKGMGQKLQFVVTVLHNPKLIILDEPFSGLDPVNADLIKEEIFNLAKNGSTIIFSTHRMEQVEEICDHIALINKGKKLLDGTVKDVKQQFKEHIFQITVDTADVLLSSEAFDIISKEDHTYRVKIREGHEQNEVLMHFINQQVPILSFHEILPTLNEIFIRIVSGDKPVAFPDSI